MDHIWDVCGRYMNGYAISCDMRTNLVKGENRGKLTRFDAMAFYTVDD